MKPYRVLLCSTFLHQLLIYSVRPYVSLLADELGANSMQVGLLIMLSSILPVMMALPIAAWINRFGCRRLTILAGMIYLLACGMLTIARTLAPIAVAMLLIGMAYTLELTTLQFQSTRADLGAPLSRVIGYYTLYNSLGVSVGSFVGGQLNELLGMNFCFVGSFMIALINLVFVWMLRAPELTVRRETSGTIREVLTITNMPAILICGGLTMYALEIVNTYFPLYGKEIGLSSAQIGIILSAGGIGQLVIRPFLHSLTQRVPLFVLLGTFMAVSGVGILCFGFARSYLLCIGIAVWTGLSLGILNPLCLFAMTAMVELTERAKALAVRVMVNFTGQAIGPVGFGALASAAGYRAVFWSSGVLLLASALINLGRRLQRQTEDAFRQ